MRTAAIGFLISLSLLCSCSIFPEEEEALFLPVNMTSTIVQGQDTKKIIADFHYVPGTRLLDHITWSNHQTHYFEYGPDENLKVVRKVKVKEKIQEERWFTYEGTLATRVLLVEKPLNYITLEPVDSIVTGWIEMEYDGGWVSAEKEFRLEEDGEAGFLVKEVEYTYDAEGNIVHSASKFQREDREEEQLEMSYDDSRHPFSELRYYFQGESYVNNLLSKTSQQEGFDYHYELRFNATGYPEIVYEKLGSTHSRITRFSYMEL